MAQSKKFAGENVFLNKFYVNYAVEREHFNLGERKKRKKQVVRVSCSWIKNHQLLVKQMSFSIKHKTLATYFIVCCILFSSCSSKTQETTANNKFKTLSELQQPSKKTKSLSDKFSLAREKTEFIDDETEKMLNRHKKWFFLGLIVFVMLAFQSLINYRQD